MSKTKLRSALDLALAVNESDDLIRCEEMIEADRSIVRRAALEEAAKYVKEFAICGPRPWHKHRQLLNDGRDRDYAIADGIRLLGESDGEDQNG